MAQNNQNNPPLAVVYLGTISDAGDYPVCHLPRKFVLVGAKLLNQADITESDTNYVTLTLKNGATPLGSLDTKAANEGGVTKNVSKDFTMVADAQELAAGSDLKVAYAEGGTGTLTLAQLQLIGYFL